VTAELSQAPTDTKLSNYVFQEDSHKNATALPSSGTFRVSDFQSHQNRCVAHYFFTADYYLGRPKLYYSHVLVVITSEKSSSAHL
jgi:hypothetical protein